MFVVRPFSFQKVGEGGAGRGKFVSRAPSGPPGSSLQLVTTPATTANSGIRHMQSSLRPLVARDCSSAGVRSNWCDRGAVCDVGVGGGCGEKQLPLSQHGGVPSQHTSPPVAMVAPVVAVGVGGW